MAKAIGYAAQHSFSSLKAMPVERRDPTPEDVELEVLYCGVCHSDIHQVKNEWHNTVYPCMPGHEIVGRVTRVGAAVKRFAVGDVAAVGCMVDSCGKCKNCSEGNEQYCAQGFLATYNGPMKPDGTNTFGGYSNQIVVKDSFVLKLPAGMDPARSAPLLCAGVTTYSPMKHWKLSPGQEVGIVGFGGLGHVATQIAKAMGANVTVFSRTKEKREDALRLGASKFVVSDQVKEMKEVAGKYNFLLVTIPEAFDINLYVPLLATNGTITTVGLLDNYKKPINNMLMAAQRLTAAGSLIGSIAETQEVLEFCKQHNIAAQIELIDIESVNDIFAKVEKGEIRYRAVIDMKSLKTGDLVRGGKS